MRIAHLHDEIPAVCRIRLGKHVAGGDERTYEQGQKRERPQLSSKTMHPRRNGASPLSAVYLKFPLAAKR